MSRILLIDDDPMTLRWLRRVFEHENHVVLSSIPNAALDLVRATDLDLIITNHGVGSWTSTNLIDALPSATQKVPPVIIYTGAAGVTHPSAYAVVAKGGNVEPLLQTVREALAARH